VQEGEPQPLAKLPAAQIEQEGAPCASLVEDPVGQEAHVDDDVAPTTALALPKPHSRQLACPARALNEPAGQGAHAVAPASEYVPTGQVAQLLPAKMNVPKGHIAAHHSAPAALKRPLGQDWHASTAVAPTLPLARPAAQRVHAASPSAEYAPAWQGVQAAREVLAGEGDSVPAGQGAHEVVLGERKEL